MKSKTKRPKYGTDVVHIRLDPILLENLRNKAVMEGLTLTAWLKSKLLKAVGAI